MTAKEFRRIVSVETCIDAAGAVAIPRIRAAGRPRRGPLSGEPLRRLFDRLIAASSLVSTAPVLDMRDFAWTQALRDGWRDVRAEARALEQAAAPGGTRSEFFLHRCGHARSENRARCPHTAALLDRIPGLATACFSVLAPGAHVAAHRGVTKGLVSCHLGLAVPHDGDVRMRVHDRTVRWAEGETLVFDDSYDHELWNDGSERRVVLLIRFERPLRRPGRWLAAIILAMLRRSAGQDDVRQRRGT